MYRDDAEIAQDLDNFITVRSIDRQAPLPLGVPLTEANLIAELATLVEALQPAPAFAAKLEARIGRYRPSRWRMALAGLWQRLTDILKKHQTASRAATAAAAITFVMSVFVVMPHLAPRQGLVRLPTLSAMANYTFDRGPAQDGADPSAQFVLKTTLPSSPSAANVFWYSAPASLTAEQAQQWAQRFGLQGSVYEGSGRAPNRSALQAQAPGANLLLTDGPRQVALNSYGVSFSDSSIQNLSDVTTTLSYTQAIPIAESFLRTHGLLDFSFRTEPCLGQPLRQPYNVCFVRLVDGRPVQYSQTPGNFQTSPDVTAMVGVASDGQVWGASYRLASFSANNKYPIRSTQSAWQTLLSGQPSDQIEYTRQFGAPYPASSGSVQYWTPQYLPGQRADVYGSPAIYLPFEGAGAALIQINGLTLEGSPSELESLSAEQGGYSLMHVWGTVRQDTSGQQVLEVAGWETSAYQRSFFMGTITRDNGLALLQRNDGQMFLLPNAPGNLPDGLSVAGNGQASGRMQDGYPVLDWTYLQSPPGAGRAPFSRRISQISGQAFVEQVELVYYVAPATSNPNGAAASSAPELAIVQPMWRFTGHTANGSPFEVLVQAVRDEYLKR